MMYIQCHLMDYHGNRMTSWIKETLATVGNIVKLDGEDALFRVVEVYAGKLPWTYLKMLESVARRGMPSIQGEKNG